ncbi:MAG: hypothetical protein R2856_03150 [Caldilineaceae bacterium]
MIAYGDRAGNRPARRGLGALMGDPAADTLGKRRCSGPSPGRWMGAPQRRC